MQLLPLNGEYKNVKTKMRDSKSNSTYKKIVNDIHKVPVSLSNTLKFRSYNLDFNGYEVPVYDLYEISQAEDVDGILKRAIKRKRALFTKNGWYLYGKNKESIAYVEKRLSEIGYAQGTSMNLLIKNIGGDLIRYNNAYLRQYIKNGRIVGYSLIPPETVYHKKDKSGNTIGYMQVLPDGRFKKYAKRDVIHFRMNPRSGLSIAPPTLLPAVDDIRALRRIEENVELLIEQHLFPLLVVSIGTDQFPATQLLNGKSEIDEFAEKLQEMPASGSIVVSHRHKFELVGSNSVLDVSKYLEHFKQRAYTAVGVSNLDMGEGQGMNRSTADSASEIIIDDVKDYQDEFKHQIELYIIAPILLEKYNRKVLNKNNMVYFIWNEISVETQIKKENHEMLKYQANLITESEMRESIGKFDLTKSERGKLYSNLYNSVQENNAAKNKQQPTNQHGSKSGPEGRKSSVSNTIVDSNQVYNILKKLSDLEINDKDVALLLIKEYILSLDMDTDFYYLVNHKLEIVRSILSNSDAHLDIVSKSIANILNKVGEVL